MHCLQAAVDDRLQIRDPALYPPHIQTAVQRQDYTDLCEFWRAAVEHVNGDLKKLFGRLCQMPPHMHVSQLKLVNDACVYSYAFVKKLNPMHLQRFDARFQN